MDLAKADHLMKSIHDIRRDNLRQLIAYRFDGSQTEFAKKVGLQQPSFVSRLLTDREPTRKNIGNRLARRFENALGYEPNFLDIPDAISRGIKFSRRGPDIRNVEVGLALMDLDAGAASEANPMHPPAPKQAGEQRVPLLSAGNLGRFASIAAVYEGKPPGEMITVHAETTPPHVVALQLPDDSMGERFPEGSIVVIADTRPPRANDFVAVVLPGDGIASMRRWVEVADRRFLIPLNRAYQATEVTSVCRILGVVIEARAFL